MDYLQPSTKLRAVVKALRAKNRELNARTDASLVWIFGPRERVAIIFVAPVEYNSNEFQIRAAVDAQADRDREPLVSAYAEGSSAEKIADWVFDALCLRP